MTYEEYEEHNWQEGESLIINNEIFIFEDHDEVYGQVWVNNDNLPRAKSVRIDSIEFAD